MNTNINISVFLKFTCLFLFIGINLCATKAVAQQFCTSPLIVTTVTAQNLRCYHDNTGSVAITVKLDPSLTAQYYNYSLTGSLTPAVTVPNYPLNNYTFTGLSADANYFVVAQVKVNQDLNNDGNFTNDFVFCYQTIPITEPAPLSITSGLPKMVSCSGGNDGAIDAIVAGGPTAPYTYSWSNGATTEDISGLTAGTYTLTIIDGNGCTLSNSFTITEPDPIVANTAATQITCGGSTNGSVSLTPTGGTAPYSAFAWSNGATTQNISGLAPGTYSVTFNDSKGCPGTASATINPAPAPVTATATPAQISCGGLTDGSISVTPAGGTAPYSAFAWSNGALTQNISGLAPGTYTVTFQDSKGCPGTASATINPAPTLVTATALPTQISCNTANDGSIVLTISGGTAPYSSFIWSNGATTQNISGLAPGTYSVTFSDSKGCPGTASATINAAPTALTGTATPTQITCNTLTNGSIALAPAGGTAPYSAFAWSNGAATQNISALAPGTYTVTFQDSKGCTGTASATINPAPAVTGNAVATQITCGGSTNGSVSLTPAGGTAPYSAFAWSNGATTQNISGLAPGTYSVTFNDSKGCPGTASAIINPAPAPVTATATPAQISCGGLTDGSISVTPAGGTAPYSAFAWSNGAVTQNISGLAPGTYTVTFQDSKGCPGTASATINPAPALVTATALPTQISCNTANDGSIVLTISGGTAPYSSFIWSNGATTQNISGLAPGTYSVTFSDSKGCSGTASATINAAPTALTGTATPTQITCNTLTNGSIALAPAGGNAPYSAFAWSNGAATQNISALAPGTYTVTFQDSKGCTGTASATINPAPAVVTGNATPVQITCGGSTNGSVSLTPAGGTAPYSAFAWSNGATTQNISGLAPGTYSVTFNDSKGCPGTASAIINPAPAPVTATATPAQISCGGLTDGSISVTPAGGTAPYSAFAWSNGALTQNISGLAPGTYTVTFQDSKGCPGTASATINPAPALVTATGTTSNATCNGNTNGSVILTPGGGLLPYSYSWSNGATSKDLTNVGPGTYTVIVTDNNGCKPSAPVSFTINPTLTVTAAASASPASVCSGLPTTITAAIGSGFTANATAYSFNGGLTFQSSASFPVAHISGDTIINVVVKDINGCISNPIPVTVTTTKIIGAGVTQTKSILCHGATTGELTVTATGNTTGYSYAINGGATKTSPVFSNLPAGTYTISIDNGTGCDASYNATITQPALLTLAIKSTTDVNPCTGSSVNGSIAVTANGGTKAYAFTITPSGVSQPDSTFTNLPAGNYTIEVSDVNTCTETVNTTINAPAPLAISATPPIQPTCANQTGGAVDITVTDGTPGYTYLWSNGATTQDLNNMGAGTYKLIVTDSKNCKDSITVVIDPAPSITGTANASPASVCSGLPTTITAAIDAAYTPAAIAYSFDGGLTFQPSPSFPIAHISGDTTINVVLKDVNGCISNPIPVTVTTTKIIGAGVTQTKSILCHGATTGELTVTATGNTTGYSYAINGGATKTSPVFSNLPAGTYTISIDNGTGCDASYNATITQPALLTLAIKSTTDVNPCTGSTSNGSIAVTANGGTKGYTFNITPSGITQPDSVFNNLAAGSYTINITDANGCLQTVNTTINTSIPLSLTVATSTEPTCANQTGGAADVTVSGGTPAYTYLWSNGATTEDLTNVGAGTYKLIVTDSKNCRDSITAIINPAPAITGTATAGPATLCSGEATTITAAVDAAYTPAANAYSFDGGVTFQSAATFPIAHITADTIINVVVKDINGCISNPITVTVTTTKIIGAGVTQTKSILCHGATTGELTVTIPGNTTGYSYSIDNGVTFQPSPVFSSLAAGVYIIIIIIDNGTSCNASYTAVIDEPAPLTLAIKSTTDVNPCAGGNNGSISVTTNGGNGGNSFTITPSGLSQPDSTFKTLTAGTYSITIKDSKGCIATTTATLTEPAGVDTSAIIPIIENNKCPGKIEGAVRLTNVSGGMPDYTYTLNGIQNSTSIFTNLLSGSYTMIITDKNNCKSNYLFAITEPATIKYTSSAIPSSCIAADGSIEIKNVSGGTPPYRYRINESTAYVKTTLFTGLAPGVYHTSVIDTNNCGSFYDDTLKIKPAPIPYVRIQEPTCNGGADGFIVLDSIYGGVPLFQYEIDGSPVGSSTAYSDKKAGTYELTIIDQSCTYKIDSFFVYNHTTNVYDSISASGITVTEPAGVTATVFSNDADRYENSGVAGIYDIKGGTPGYLWSADNIIFEPVAGDTVLLNKLSRGHHTIFVLDTNGCAASFEITILVEFFIPNLITPNKDGKNDRFEIMALPRGSMLKIVNRWGNEVYLNNNYDNSWDADEDSDGVFYYELVLPDGKRYKGWIEVIR